MRHFIFQNGLNESLPKAEGGRIQTPEQIKAATRRGEEKAGRRIEKRHGIHLKELLDPEFKNKSREKIVEKIKPISAEKILKLSDELLVKLFSDKDGKRDLFERKEPQIKARVEKAFKNEKAIAAAREAMGIKSKKPDAPKMDPLELEALKKKGVKGLLEHLNKSQVNREDMKVLLADVTLEQLKALDDESIAKIFSGSNGKMELFGRDKGEKGAGLKERVVRAFVNLAKKTNPEVNPLLTEELNQLKSRGLKAVIEKLKKTSLHRDDMKKLLADVTPEQLLALKDPKELGLLFPRNSHFYGIDKFSKHEELQKAVKKGQEKLSTDTLSDIFKNKDKLQSPEVAEKLKRVTTKHLLGKDLPQAEEGKPLTDKQIAEYAKKEPELAKLFLKTIEEGKIFIVDFQGHEGAIQNIGLGDLLPPTQKFVKVNGVVGKRSISGSGKVGYLTREGRYIPVFGGEKVELQVSEAEQKGFDTIRTLSPKEEIENKKRFKENEGQMNRVNRIKNLPLSPVEKEALNKVAEDLKVDPCVIQAIMRQESGSGNLRAVRHEPPYIRKGRRKGYSPEEAEAYGTSYGRFQIMGFNYAKCGFSSPLELKRVMMTGTIGDQFNAFANFIRNKPPLHRAMQNKEWSTIAHYYNGAGYARNNYDNEIRNHYQAFKMREGANMNMA